MRSLFSVFLLLSSVLFTAAASARTLDVVVGWDKPPYVMSETDSGFELELVRQILRELGHEMRVIYVPFGRTMSMVEDSSIDIVLTTNERHPVNSQFLTAPYVIYQNVAVTLQSRHLKIRSLDDFRGRSVIAFQTAANVLGNDYAAAVEQASGYLEMPEQRRQVSMLLLGSVDVAVIDRNIFNYFKKQLPITQQKSTVVHELFGTSAYSAAIRDPELRARFDQILKAMIADGRYQTLLDRFGLVNLLNRLPARLTQFPSATN